jgi:hypothetical protein
MLLTMNGISLKQNRVGINKCEEVKSDSSIRDLKTDGGLQHDDPYMFFLLSTKPHRGWLRSEAQILRQVAFFPCNDTRLGKDPIDIKPKFESYWSLHYRVTG